MQDWAWAAMHSLGSLAYPLCHWWAEGVQTTSGLGAPQLHGQGSAGPLASPCGHLAQPPSFLARVALVPVPPWQGECLATGPTKSGPAPLPERAHRCRQSKGIAAGSPRPHAPEPVPDLASGPSKWVSFTNKLRPAASTCQVSTHLVGLSHGDRDARGGGSSPSTEGPWCCPSCPGPNCPINLGWARTHCPLLAGWAGSRQGRAEPGQCLARVIRLHAGHPGSLAGQDGALPCCLGSSYWCLLSPTVPEGLHHAAGTGPCLSHAECPSATRAADGGLVSADPPCRQHGKPGTIIRPQPGGAAEDRPAI